MIKTLVAVTFGLLGAAIISGCVVRSEPAVVVRPAPAVVVRPAPAVVYAEPVMVVPEYKYKYKQKGRGNSAVILVP